MERLESIQSHLVKLADIFDRMDQAYDEMARQLGFHCRGCNDNCCRSLFYHHTVAEYLFLRSGLAQLPDHRQQQIRRRASATIDREANGSGANSGHAQPGICPLNEAGRCILYAYRPMICRLHGIPHQLRRPNGQIQTGPGCDAFYRQGSALSAGRLDRTTWYGALAQLEAGLRQYLGFGRKLKMTIARMLVEELESLEIHR